MKTLLYHIDLPQYKIYIAFFSINSHTNTQPFNNIKPVDSIRPFKEVPLIDQLPFLDNIQSQKEENNNNLNSTIEPEAIKAPELPLDSRTADQTQD